MTNPISQSAPRANSGPCRDALTATERACELARLVPLWPAEIADTSLAGRRRLVAKLERVLRAERQRGLAGHWTYDLTRHAELLRVWRRETAALKTASAEKAVIS